MQTLHASSVETATGNDNAGKVDLVAEHPVGLKAQLAAQVIVTAVSGTNPTLDVLVQDSLDGVNWTTLIAFTQLTGTGSELKKVANPAKFIRASWTIGGTDTPTFTFSVVFLER